MIERQSNMEDGYGHDGVASKNTTSDPDCYDWQPIMPHSIWAVAMMPDREAKRAA